MPRPPVDGAVLRCHGPARNWYINHRPHGDGYRLQLRAERVTRAFRPTRAHMRNALG